MGMIDWIAVYAGVSGGVEGGPRNSGARVQTEFGACTERHESGDHCGSPARARLRANVAVDHPAHVERLRQVPRLDQLLLQPFELVHGNRHLGVDAGVRTRRFREHELRARIACLDAGNLARDSQFLVAVGEGIAVALHLRGQEADGILAPGVKQLAGGHRAEPQIFRHHVAAARDELDAVVLADGQELNRDDGSERNAAEQGFVTLGVVAEARELHLGRRARRSANDSR